MVADRQAHAHRTPHPHPAAPPRQERDERTEQPVFFAEAFVVNRKRREGSHVTWLQTDKRTHTAVFLVEAFVVNVSN